MPSEVEISRLALAHIADAARVDSIDPPDNTVQAKHCATFYPIARDTCLADGLWPFARKRKALNASLVTFDEYEWEYVYQLPSDYLRAVKVVGPGARKDFPGVDFYIESDETELDLLLYTNQENAILHYVFREEETGRYSPIFVSALSYLLASYLAGPIIKGRVGTQVKESMYKLYLNEIQRAETRDIGPSHRRDDEYATYKPKWVTDR